MRKLLAILALSISTAACANPYHNHHHHHGSGWGWVAPAVIGGMIVYGATRPAPAPAPVIIQPQLHNPTSSSPVVVPKYPGMYPETPNTVWQQDWRYDQFCNCYRQFLIQVQ